MVTALVIFIIFCLVMIIIKLQNKPQSQPGQKSLPKLTHIERISTQTYGAQLLESLSILENTKKLETLNSRIDFVLTKYPALIDLSGKSDYINAAKMAVKKYAELYPARTINNTQFDLLFNPSMDNLKKHIASLIVLSYANHVKEEVVKIDALIRESAINNRNEKLADTGYNMKYLFKTHNIPSDGHLETIEEIRKQFHSSSK